MSNNITVKHLLCVIVLSCGSLLVHAKDNIVAVRSACLDNIRCYKSKSDVSSIRFSGAKNQKLNSLVVVSSTENLENVNFRVTDLTQIGGPGVVNQGSINLRYVIGWYRETKADMTIHHGKGREYYYDLLAKDADLLASNHSIKKTKIKIQDNNNSRHIDISDLGKIGKMERDGRIKYSKKELSVKDATKLTSTQLSKDRPVRLLIEINENVNINPGEYTGKLIITRNKKAIKEINIVYSVSDIYLDVSNIDYCIYYRGKYKQGEETYSSEYKSIEQLRAELSNIRKAGFDCISIYQDLDNKKAFEKYMSVIHELKYNKLIVTDSRLNTYMKNGDMNGFSARLMQYRELFNSRKNLYVYMIDEPTKKINSQLDKFRMEVLTRGYFPVTAGRFDRIKSNIVKNGIYIVAYEPDKTIANYIHSMGAKVYSYANPQAGLISPFLYRMNYGLKLHVNNYDGAMPYAYQDSRGGQWDDQDGRYRDHMFTYPLAEGLLESLSWLGMQEAIVDSRYISTRRNLISEMAKRKCQKNYKFVDQEAVSVANWNDLDLHRQRVKDDIIQLQKILNECR